MALRRGLHPVQRRHHPHGPERDEHHRHVRRHRSQPAHIPRPPTGAALRRPLGWGCLRRFRRDPQERPRVSLVEHRGPPVCARSHEGVAAVRWGVKRSEGAKAPFLRFATLWDLWRYASDVRAWCSASATSGMGLPAALRREPQERPRESQVEHRGPHIRNLSTHIRHYATTTLHASQ